MGHPVHPQFPVLGKLPRPERRWKRQQLHLYIRFVKGVYTPGAHSSRRGHGILPPPATRHPPRPGRIGHRVTRPDRRKMPCLLAGGWEQQAGSSRPPGIGVGSSQSVLARIQLVLPGGSSVVTPLKSLLTVITSSLTAPVTVLDLQAIGERSSSPTAALSSMVWFNAVDFPSRVV